MSPNNPRWVWIAKEENALKAKLRRLCGARKNGTLQVPDWLHEQWKNGDHLQMAMQLRDCNFDKDRLLQFNMV